jgi:hypothetical protein
MLPMGADQRRFLRRPVAVEFSGRDATGAGSLVFRSEDLSQGGAFLRCELLLEEQEQLTLRFRVPGSEEVCSVQATVVWVRRFPAPDEPAGVGVAFGQLPLPAHAALSLYITAPPDQDPGAGDEPA